MQGNVDIKGLDGALKAMQAAFPKDPKKQRGVLNTAMRTAARKNIVPTAKELAKRGDGSGALSESIAVRNQSKKRLAAKGMVAGVEVVPVRFNRKAIALYVQHYYIDKGITPPANIVTSGIRHGHLVEFGSVNNTPRPFLLPAGRAGQTGYINAVGGELEKAIERRVKRARK